MRAQSASHNSSARSEGGRRRPRLWGAAGLATVAMLLSACGPTNAGATTEDGRTVVRYTQGGDSLSFANVLYAQSAGYFQDEGLEMEYLPVMQSSTDTVNLLVTDQADVVVVSPTATYGALGANRDVKTFAVTTSGASTGITLSNDTVEALEAKGVTPESDLDDRISALRGLGLAGVGASTSQYSMAEAVLEHGGLNPKTDVTMLTVPDHETAATSAREGQSDGYIAAVPQRLLGVSEGWGEAWIQFDEISELHLDTVPYMELAATPAFAESNPEVMEAMVNALYRVEEDFRTNPEEVAKVLKEDWFQEMDQEFFDDSFAAVAPYFTQGLTPTEDGFQAALELFNSTGDRPISLNFDDVYNTSYLKD